MSKDIFAPMTDEDRLMFAPMQTDEPSAIGSFGLGAAQGITLGFSDEMEAALRSALSGELTKSQYETKLKDIRERYKKYEKANPISSIAGNIAGGLALPVPGGLAASGTKGATSIWKAAKVGAGAGAIAGLGTSEESLLDNPSGVLGDVATGVLGGAITGAAIPAAGKALSKSGKFIAEQPLTEEAIQIMQDARQGIIHSGEDMLNKRASELMDAAKGIQDKLSKAQLKEGGRLERIVGKLEQKASQKGETFNVNPILEKFKQVGPLYSEASEEAVDALEKAVNVSAGKGDTFKILKQLDRKVAEAQTGKILENRRIAEKIQELETLDLDEKGQAVLSALKKRFDFNEQAIAEALKPAEIITDPATGIPSLTRERKYQDFLKASEGITEFNPDKTPKQIREMQKVLNKSDVIEATSAPEAAALRSEIKNELNDMLMSGASSREEQVFFKAKERYAKLSKLMEGSGLQAFYGVGEASDKVVDARRLYDIIKGFNREGSKEGAFFRDFLDKAKEINPQLADKIEQDVATASRNYSLTGALHAPKAFPEKGLKFLLPSGKAMMMKTAEGIGEGQAKIDVLKDFVTKELPKKVFSSIDRDNSSVLRRMSDVASAAGNSDLANKLKKVLDQPGNKQKAIMFALMQQPQYREIFAQMKELLGD